MQLPFVWRARDRRQRGSLTVETALVFPILVMIMFGIIDAGRFIATRVMLSQAAAAGARNACLSASTAASVTTAVRGAATMLSSSITVPTPACLTAAGVDCTATWPKTANMRVAVTVQYTFASGWFSVFSKTMQNTSRVVC